MPTLGFCLLTLRGGRGGGCWAPPKIVGKHIFFPKSREAHPHGGGGGMGHGKIHRKVSFGCLLRRKAAQRNCLAPSELTKRQAVNRQAPHPPGGFSGQNPKRQAGTPPPGGGGLGRRTLEQKLGPHICFHRCLLLLSGLFLRSPFAAVVPPQRIVFKLFFPTLRFVYNFLVHANKWA